MKNQFEKLKYNLANDSISSDIIFNVFMCIRQYNIVDANDLKTANACANKLLINSDLRLLSLLLDSRFKLKLILHTARWFGVELLTPSAKLIEHMNSILPRTCPHCGSHKLPCRIQYSKLNLTASFDVEYGCGYRHHYSPVTKISYQSAPCQYKR